ncbi:MAG: hypothetical protein V1773_16165 [bacterium]
MEINKVISDIGSYGVIGQTKRRPENTEAVESLPVQDARLAESSSEKIIRMVVEMTENSQPKNSTEYGSLNKGSVVDKYA